MILTPLQKFPNNVGDLGKIIVATGCEWLPKVQNIAQSGHTGWGVVALVRAQITFPFHIFCFPWFGIPCELFVQSFENGLVYLVNYLSKALKMVWYTL